MDVWQAIIAFLATIFGFSYFTNPFSRWTIIRRHYRASLKKGVLQAINENQHLRVNNSLFLKILAVANNGIYILSSRWHKRPTSHATTVEAIIDDIYRLRFNPNKLLLTSGDHFSSLFVRNLGVFYYPVLDTHLPTTEDKWRQRQLTYLQTVAYALGVFEKSDHISTTIVPTGRHRATCINFHSYPSDTMYGILYALAALIGKEKARPEDYGNEQYPLDTADAAHTLIETYRKRLTYHYEHYRAYAFDEMTGLINKNVTMSGAKDITMRSSAFYDNVVFWKTTELASKLGLIEVERSFLDDLRRRILDTFWLKDEGYFLEDLSEEGIAEKYYSSDWLVVLATGFISPTRAEERIYFERSVQYIQKHHIDKPFAIKYQSDTRAHRQFPIVRFAVASYGGDSIWSFWGMEYIKVLILLSRYKNSKKHRAAADYHIDAYKQKMLEYGGYPETYDSRGNLLQTPFYRSIIQTGWVIGFEQVLAMRTDLDSKTK